MQEILFVSSFLRVDMDGDGKITFDEIIHELTHCVINAIEEKLHITVEEKMRQLNSQHLSASSSTQSMPPPSPSAQNGDGGRGVSPSLLTYLHDSFMAADLDRSGKLNNTEFWNILRTVLSLSEGDREILEDEWDKNHDGLISWSEALEQFTLLFRKYINTNQDYWVSFFRYLILTSPDCFGR